MQFDNSFGLEVNVEKEFSYPLVIKDASMIIINSIPKGYIGALDQDWFNLQQGHVAIH